MNTHLKDSSREGPFCTALFNIRRDYYLAVRSTSIHHTYLNTRLRSIILIAYLDMYRVYWYY